MPRVIANIGLTLDGCYQGPGGRWDHEAVASYAQHSEVASDQIVRTIRTATTAVLGRVNAEHFFEVWPPVIGMPGADPRHEAYARWVDSVDKVVLSSTLSEFAWKGSRVVNAPAAEVVAELRTSSAGDILVSHSGSVIKALLAADAVDQLNLIVTPAVVGGPYRLFDEGLPGSRWTLASHDSDDQGVVGLTYDRIR
jgi:dihydrofolate reductase